MRKSTGLDPSLRVDASGKRVVLHAGSVLLALTADKAGLSRGLSAALAPWRKPMAVHDPGKILLDLAISLAIGGDCLAHVAQLRAEPAVFGHVASDPTVSRLIDTLAADAPAALKAIDAPRAGARARVWKLAGPAAPNHDRSAKAPLVVDVDATLVTAHSEKQLAKATFKRGFGFHPIGAWVAHGPGGIGEPVAMLLRPGNAGSNTAADHIGVVKAAVAQLPCTTADRRPGRGVLIRDRRGGRHPRVRGLVDPATGAVFGRIHPNHRHHRPGRRPAGRGADSGVRRRRQAAGRGLGGRADRDARAGQEAEGARHRPRRTSPSRRAAQVHRLERQPTHRVRHEYHRWAVGRLELRHRRRARCEDRIRNAKDTGLNNLPLNDPAQNKIWVAVVQLATELTAWMRIRAFTRTPARAWEPKKLRHRLFSVAARIGRKARRTWLCLSAQAPHRDPLLNGLHRLPQPT